MELFNEPIIQQKVLSDIIKNDNIITNSTMVGGSFSGGKINIGSGENMFTANKDGIFLGSSSFETAPFSVDMQGNLYAGSATIAGDIVSSNYSGTAPYTGYKLEYSTGNAYFGGAIISGSSIIGTAGILANTIGSAINSSGNFINHLINTRINTSTGAILGTFDVNATTQTNVGFRAGTITWDAAGALVSGSGVAMTPNGIIGAKAGVATFTIDTDGDATFSGDITGATITGGIIQTATSNDRIILNGSSNSLEFKNSDTMYASMSPYTLYQSGSPIGYGFSVNTGTVYSTTAASLSIYEGTGGTTSTDIISDFIDLNGTTFSKSIIPSVGSSYDIGSTSYRYSNAYLNSIGLYGSSSGVITFKPSSASGTWTLTLPTSAGSSGQVLATNGSGTTSWITPSSFSGNLSDLYINTAKNWGGYGISNLGNLIGSTSSSVNLGSSASNSWWNSLYVQYIYGPTGSNPINIKNNAWTQSLMPDYSNSFYCGLTSSYWYQVSTRIVTGNNTSQRIDFISTANKIQYHATSAHDFYQNGNIKAIIDNNIWTAGNLMADGTKPFVIKHPDGSDRLLRYTAQESPEVILRDRGKAKTSSLKECEVLTPKHFEMITEPKELVTVNITPIGDNHIYIEGTPNNKGFKVKSDNENVEFFYEIIAIRKGYANSAIEIDKNSKGKDRELFNILKK